ncbi:MULTISPECIES: bifunctional 4-hydroxy-2-oxoglutarate aldolase/2-dehydro-3-deoxy-phosphogluconate aldolase [unclassified Nesterenkonia]|uniref:bifunctional 4-hydroxy-2-oxoglutarate aldolase/2-dehydro-3-deoxy-phosphogluconate aldolase n=1 Tax=unclassified Nesterenkonia TaxID=2629769 RepID=UPI000871FC79|nr:MULTISPECIES: bifunctional 4-hydroxy-2-oxoglutarate aldolase/2-dehydro-3-deoxy-phosphogluconate aldolase [unclassified Nesterenkonia]MDS2171794.1 bifunctional 4-hydroxy-2-oxoglutarate aldolase/2-dehydro-3-deoxy-phosphogluconate aldolase [Nesterenkonia sp. CL21]OSM43929.1 keto-deoxy-phosphogluconate aldolase [Nesterenkonia sp. PF2B19]
MTDALATIAHHGVVPVVTLHDADHAPSLGRALIAGGLPVAEVTFRSAAAESSVAALTRTPDLLVGAGTIVTAEQVDRAATVGAQFIVSPGLSRAVVDRAAAHGLPVIPGAVTATEVQSALEMGLTTVKFFPAATSGGPEAISALSAPFPQVRFMPTGGVTTRSLPDYLGLPSVLAVGGSWMVPSDLLTRQDEAALTGTIRHSVEHVAHVRRDTRRRG